MAYRSNNNAQALLKFNKIKKKSKLTQIQNYCVYNEIK